MAVGSLSPGIRVKVEGGEAPESCSLPCILLPWHAHRHMVPNECSLPSTVSSFQVGKM